MSTTKPKETIASEFNECVALAQYLTLKGIKFSHLAQETPSGKQVNGRWQPNFNTIRKNKAVGVNKGVPDYIIIIEKPGHENLPYKTNLLLFIEMKRTKGGKESPEQAEWRRMLNKVPGVAAVVSKGFEAAKETIDAFLIQV